MSANNGSSIHLIHNAKRAGDTSPLHRFGRAGLVLPVGPIDQVSISENIIVNNETLPRRGAVVFGGGRGAKQINVNTVFPLELVGPHIVTASQNQRNSAGVPMAPKDYDEILAEVGQGNHIFDLVIADTSIPDSRYAIMLATPVLMQSYNSTFSYGLDIDVSMEFIEYQEVRVRRVKVWGRVAGNWSDRKGEGRRPGKKPRPKYIKLRKRSKKSKKPENLAQIAEKYYGKTKAWRWIAQHPKNIEAFGVVVKKTKKKKAIPSHTHANLKVGTKVYLPDTTEKDSTGKTFWASV